MGHKSFSSTEVYTKVFALDVSARHRVKFQIPELDAIAILKRGNLVLLVTSIMLSKYLTGTRQANAGMILAVETANISKTHQTPKR
ncbi:hypothetical protein AV650_11125 [Serratia fonticola]|nr:hypothetical protein AV650_11125 [Serratia fonticola]